VTLQLQEWKESIISDVTTSGAEREYYQDFANLGVEISYSYL